MCRPCLRLLRAALIWDDEVLPEPGLHALFRMTPPLLSLIHGFKYRHYRRHIRFLCAYLRYRPAFVEALGKPDVLVPVPLHSARRRERGYNQAAALADALAEAIAAPRLAGALTRVRSTRAQARLGPAERRRNIAGAFRVERPAAMKGRSVLLVDDVMTTGATLESALAALAAAGAVATGVTLAWAS